MTPNPEVAPGGHSAFYLPALDGLRLIAFLMVFCHHTFPWSLPPNQASEALNRWWRAGVMAAGYGVSLFFALSSFLITTLLLEEKTRSRTVSLKNFYLRRILRIWPLYFSILLLVIFLNPFYRAHNARLTRYMSWSFATFTANLAMSAGKMSTMTVAPLWSVCIEEQFYLCWPVIMLFLSRRALTCFAIAMVGTGLAYRLWVAGGHVRPDVIWYHSLSQLDCFAYGCLAALYLRNVTIKSRVLRVTLIIGAFLAVLTIERYLPYKSAEMVTGSVTRLSVAAYTLIAALFALVVWLASSMNEGWLATRVPVFFGKRTYGLYCLHSAVITTLDIWVSYARWETRALCALAVTIPLAIASYRYLELPFLRLKQRFQVIHSGADRL